MADITGTARLTLAKNSNPSIVITVSATQSGSKYESGVQSIGTTEETLSQNDVGTIGYLGINNLDATNYVELGATTGVYSAKLAAGCGALIPWDGATVYAKAHTGACLVEYLIIEA
jgi:hypothetical protein